MVVCLLVWLPWQQKASIDLKWENGLITFLCPCHKKWQVYYVILSEFLSVRPPIRMNIRGLGAIFGAILDILMRYFEFYSI